MARMLDVGDARDIASVVALRVAAPRAHVLTWLQGPESRRVEPVLTNGLIGDPPDPSDVADLTVGAREAGELGSCRPGDCEMKLPPDAVARLAALRGSAVSDDAGGCRVVFLNHVHSDAPSGFSGLQRSLVNLLVRRRLRTQWQHARVRLEAAWRSAEGARP
jgi:hypothetical protein